MIISIIVAVDECGGIGVQNSLPWRLKADQKRFKRLTMGHHLIMGRKTYQAIGRSLPGRPSIVITRNPDYFLSDCLVAHSVEDALSIAEISQEDEVFVIGGSDIFKQSLHLADRLYLTIVHTRAQADVFFPGYQQESWIENWSSYHPADEDNQYPSTFKLLDRKHASGFVLGMAE